MTRPTILRRKIPLMERRKMTVCIATTCDLGTGDPKIILCSDWLTSGALGRAETKFKQRILHKNWNLLMAGAESDMNSLATSFRGAFLRHKPSIDETNVVQIVRDCLFARKKEKADELIRGRHAISYDDLLNFGKEKLPADIFREAIASVRDLDLGAEFIIAGFADGFPIIIETDVHGSAKIREDFAVIGEGCHLAQSVLLHRQHSDLKPLSNALYIAYEAKKYAEGASSVGANTMLAILTKDGKQSTLTLEGRNFLSEKYKKYGPQNLPENLDLPDNVLNTRQPLN